jgi:hypothetical protein
MGNIGEVAVHHRQPDGSFIFTLDFVYLYYTDGNLYKKMTYSPVENGEPLFLSTDTYEYIADSVNPFPIEIVYGQPAQSKLPSMFRHQLEGNSYEFAYSYEYLPDGRPSSRTVTGPGTRETARYVYY